MTVDTNVVEGLLALIGIGAAWMAPSPKFRRNGNGHPPSLSDEPGTVEFRTRMALVMEGQQVLGGKIEGHMAQQTQILQRLSDSAKSHQEAFDAFVKEAKWIPRRKRA